MDAKVDLNQPSFMIDKCQLLIQPKNKESGK